MPAPSRGRILLSRATGVVPTYFSIREFISEAIRHVDQSLEQALLEVTPPEHAVLLNELF
jgi:hypothetical protein